MTLRSPFRDRLLGDFHSVACPLWDPSLHNYFVDEPSHNPSFVATPVFVSKLLLLWICGVSTTDLSVEAT